MSQRPRVLFLCTGNSCRSQMGEGFLRELGDYRSSGRRTMRASYGGAAPSAQREE